jgi:hypothetical protein
MCPSLMETGLKWWRWRQKAVSVGHPHLEWVGKYPWPHKRIIVDGRIFTKLVISYRVSNFMDKKGIFETQPMEHSRTSPKSAPCFLPRSSKPGLREDLVG